MTTNKEIDRNALIAKLYTAQQLLARFNEDFRTANNSVELAFKLGRWQTSLTHTIEQLIEEVEQYND